MKKDTTPKSSPQRIRGLRKYFWLSSVVWTFAIVAVLIVDLRSEQDNFLAMARNHARALVARDIMYRRWSTGHGGVYVPVTESTPPNPYLDIAERDITTPSGRLLTLVNPAYMTRQVHELALKESGVRSHITSVKPIRPANRADDWETRALERMEKGESEVSSVELLDGSNYLRLMQPLITVQGCLKCHENQGYQVGQIGGGISVVVPLGASGPIHWALIGDDIIGHSLILVLGLGGIAWMFSHLRGSIRHRIKIERALREQDDRMRVLYESASDAVMTLEPPQWNATFCNPACVKMFGVRDQADFVSCPGWKFSPAFQPDGLASGDKAKKMIKIALAEGNHSFDWVQVRAGGEIFHASVTLTRMVVEGETMLQARIRDVSVQRKFEMQVHKQQKLAAIGTLARGAAHEINNPINGIMNYAQLIKDGSDKDSEAADFANEIISESKRVTEIVRGLQSFASEDEGARVTAHVGDLIDQVANTMGASLTEDNIVLTVDIAEGLPDLTCQSLRIQMLIESLIKNAQEALNDKYPDEHDDKIITVTAGLLDKDDRSWLRVTVEDHGDGFSDEIRERMFEPFFTTRDRSVAGDGVGRGLGLAIALNVARDHAGSLSAECSPGNFTRIHLDLPV